MKISIFLLALVHGCKKKQEVDLTTTEAPTTTTARSVEIENVPIELDETDMSGDSNEVFE